MKKLNPKVTEYIAGAPDFAIPILEHLRELIHSACPDIEEKIKWKWPHYDYKGMLISTGAFKEHVTINFWKAEIMDDPDKIMKPTGEGAMGQFGAIKSLDDLPSDEQLAFLINEARRLNDEGVKLPKKTPPPKTELVVPEFFQEALNQNNAAKKTFEGFSYSNQKEYLEWVTEAKREDTKMKRLATAMEWMAEGKVRMWKYQ